MRFKWLFLTFLLSGCASNPLWKVDTISSGSSGFDFTKLSFQNPSGVYAPLKFELARTDQEVFSYLFLRQFRFAPSSPKEVAIKLTIEDFTCEERSPLLEGGMKLRLSSTATELIISSLQEGKKVGILIDGFEETLSPDGFSKIYERWMGPFTFFSSPFKGPVE